MELKADRWPWAWQLCHLPAASGAVLASLGLCFLVCKVGDKNSGSSAGSSQGAWQVSRLALLSLWVVFHEDPVVPLQTPGRREQGFS